MPFVLTLSRTLRELQIQKVKTRSVVEQTVKYT